MCVEHEEQTDEHEQQLGREVGDGEQDVDGGRLGDADDVDPAQQDDHAHAEEDVARRGLQEREEQPPDVVGHEERGDRDRDRVVEHLAPGGEERPELVEGVPGERRGAARLREHRRRLGIRGGRQVEDDPGEHEHNRREAERERGDEPERVVDRRADVPVGRRGQRVDAKHALESLQTSLSHQPASGEGGDGDGEGEGAGAVAAAGSAPSCLASNFARQSAGGAVRMTRHGALLITYLVTSPT